MHLSRILGAAAFAVVIAAAAAAQDKVDNPEFASWSKFKKGTSVTLKTTSEAGGTTSETLITTTLVDVAADKLVVETATVTKVNGMEFKTPPMKRDVPKAVQFPAGAKKVEFDPKKVPGAVEEGSETVKIAGGEFKTKWYKTKLKAAGSEVESKSWLSDDVPGRLVKMESATKGAVAAKTRMELVEVKKP